jgi:hypothetical protein
MAVSSASSPIKAASAIMELPAGQHRADALRHLIAKHPHMAALPARDFISEDSSYDDPDRMLGKMTLSEVADGDDTETRDAA